MRSTSREETATYYAVIQAIACEQLRFLTERYRMTPAEIIHLYTGKKPLQATTELALHAMMMHRLTAESMPRRRG